MIITKIKPMFTALLVTMEKYGVDEVQGSIITDVRHMQGEIKEIQKVVAVGSSVRDIEVGQFVQINPKRYAVYEDPRDNPDSGSVLHDIKHEKKLKGFAIPRVEVDGQVYLKIDQTDVEYVIEEWEEEQPDSGLIHSEPKIIIP